MKPILFLVSALFLAACASKPTAPEANQAAAPVTGKRIAMDARAQVQNKIEKKTVTVQIEAIAIEPSALRLDVSAGFGSLMGKMIMRGEQVVILLPQQKKAYSGAVSENSLKPLLPVRLNPHDLISFLLGQVPKTWTCELKTDSLEACTDPTKVLVLEHDPRPDKKNARWSVSSSQFVLTVLPSNIRTIVQVKPELFSMNIPDGYSKHKLP